MATKRLSDILGVSAKVFESKGVFNAFIDIDSKLHVDPSLLVVAKTPEFRTSYKKFTKYFSDTIKLIEASERTDDPLWRAALRRLIFQENSAISLGYSENSASGSGIGKRLAENLLATAKLIIKAGVKDPEIFELVGLFEDDIGADRISDMSIKILEAEFTKYTQRVCKQLKIPTAKKNRSLPINPKTDKPILFVPIELLRDLPIAHSWDDVDRVAKYNAELRASLNNVVASSWKEVVRNMKKHEVRDLILNNPEILKDLIQQYREKPRSAYDFKNDPAGEVVWAAIAAQAKSHPIDLTEYKNQKLSCEDLMGIVKKICNQFSKLIEDNGWNEFLYLKKKLRNERFPQKLFFGVADIYCDANDLDITRESNAGIGALDFKVSSGKVKVSVEIKYSRNPKLIDGYEIQLPAYIRAEKACGGIYLVIQVSDMDKKLQLLKGKTAKNLPHLIITDGRIQPSASKR